jgi:hypothetical protein
LNKEEMKDILLIYRPGSGDREDPEIAAALSEAQRDSEMGLWLEQQAAFHEFVRAELRSLPVPSELKSRILTQARVVAFPFWRRRQFLLAAACLVLTAAVAALLLPRPADEETFVGFRSRMVGFAQRVYRMDIVTNDLNQVRTYLRRQGTPADYPLTPGLQATPIMGGASLTWQNHPVSMICFQLSQDRILYMFVMEQAALPGKDGPSSRPVFTPAGRLMTASWCDAGKIYLIAADVEKAALEQKAPGG